MTDSLWSEWERLLRAQPPELAKPGWERLCSLLSQEDKLASSSQAPTLFLGQMAAIAFITGWEKGQPVAVDKLINDAKLTMKEFFSNVEEQYMRLHPGAPQMPQLKQLKAHFLASSVAWRKFDEHFVKLFPTGLVAPGDASLTTIDQSKKLSWLTFCIARCLVLGSNTNPLDTYYLLVCIFELLLAHMPVEARGEAVASFTGAAPAEAYPMVPAARASLHAKLKVESDQVDKLMTDMGRLVAELRATLGLQPGSTAAKSNCIAGFLSGAAKLEDTLKKLDARYPALAKQTSQPFDDRYWLTAPMLPPGPPSSTRSAATGQPSSPQRPPPGTPKQNSALLTPLRGANPAPAPHTPLAAQTPMSGQLECVGWLRAAVADVSDEGPSDQLAAYFNRCDKSLTSTIHDRLDRLCGKLRARLETSELDSEISEHCSAGRKLYYKMLLRILESEEHRLQSTSFLASLLSQDTFHSSLFACCMEAVLASYSLTDLAFPTVIETLEVKAFDFYKVIENFIRQEPDLPKYLRRHFRDVDVKVLESLAWTDDSPLHVLTREYDQAQSSPTDAAPKRAKASLSRFLKSVEYVAATRVHDMCTRLLLRTSLIAQVWSCMKIIIQTPARVLMVGRHLDQIIMCTIYGVCKVNKRIDEDPKTFRHIIDQYKRQEKASPKVFREVRMASADDPPQDIIAFYNKIFIPSMKDHLIRVSKEVSEDFTAGSTHLIASPSAVASRLARGLASPQRVIEGRDVWVSQPRTPSNGMTPRTRTLYSFGDSPGGNLGRVDNLQRMNHQLSNAPSDGSVAAFALRALSNTPSRAGTPTVSSPLGGRNMGAPQAEMPSRKRLLEGGGMSRKQLQRRLNDEARLPERSSSNGSNGSSLPDGDVTTQ